MKTPDEIKKGLRHCSEDGCKGCNYKSDCDMADGFSVLAFDALAYIQQLEDHIRDLTKMMPEWYCVHDIIPGETKSYIICTENGAVCTARWYERSNSFNGVAGRHALYWMPLPEPPRGSE